LQAPERLRLRQRVGAHGCIHRHFGAHPLSLSTGKFGGVRGVLLRRRWRSGAPSAHSVAKAQKLVDDVKAWEVAL
jgi:hypothetical protein